MYLITKIIAGLILLTAIIIALVIFLVIAPIIPTSAFITEQFPLNKLTTIVAPTSFPKADYAYTFLKEGTGTFQCFVYLDNLLRTGAAVDCGTGSNQPSCKTGLYDEACQCTSLTDCTNCLHDGYKNLFSLYGVYNFEVLNVPDASRQQSVSAQIAVQTQTAADRFVETIPLPPLPLQKWTMITLSKSGRRVDVYYNGTLVSSLTLLNMISTLNPSGAVAQAGNSGLSGIITMININANVATIHSVSNYYSQMVDTRGNPVKLDTRAGPFTQNIAPVNTWSIVNSLCLNGSCLSIPKVSNAMPTLPQFNSSSTKSTISPLYSVQSQYA